MALVNLEIVSQLMALQDRKCFSILAFLSIVLHADVIFFIVLAIRYNKIKWKK